MKKFIGSIALGLALSISTLAVAQAQQVKVGIAAEPYPPFTSPDASGKW